MQDFYQTWLAKADSYAGNNINDYFNKAFSLFTLYNKLYGEATFTLAREGNITLHDNRPFPDSKGAKSYAPQFIGYSQLHQELMNDNACRNSVNELINLIENHTFNIKLSMPHGNPQRNKDLALLGKLKSNGAQTKVSAILDLIYSVRCNMFHGNKGFNPVQVQLLVPITIVLRKIIEALYLKLNNHHGQNP
jgi:hypothetical protein